MTVGTHTATHSGDELKAGLTQRVDRQAGSRAGGRGQFRWRHHVGRGTGSVRGQQSVPQEMSHLGETTHGGTVWVLNELLHTYTHTHTEKTVSILQNYLQLFKNIPLLLSDWFILHHPMGLSRWLSAGWLVTDNSHPIRTHHTGPVALSLLWPCWDGG